MRKSLTLFLENNFIRDIPDRWLDPNPKSGLQNLREYFLYPSHGTRNITRLFQRHRTINGSSLFKGSPSPELFSIIHHWS